MVSQEYPGGEKFAEDDLGVAHRLCRKQLEGPRFLFLRQQTHRDGGNEEEKNERDQLKHHAERGDVHKKQVAREKPPDDGKEYHDDHVGDGRVKIRPDFTAENRKNVGECRHVQVVVSLWNTSSRVVMRRCISRTIQPSETARRNAASRTSCPFSTARSKRATAPSWAARVTLFT